MNDSSRMQGLAIFGAAALLWILFLRGLWDGSWWAVAIPVAILLTFVLGLAAWVGWTIATIQVEPESPADDGDTD
jgi:hypothetical protein